MAYWDGPWASEDGGAARVQAASGRAPAGALSVVSRDAPGAHMVIVRAVDEVYLYGSTFGAGSTAWVERLDATTLEPIARVDDLAGGPWWPGGIAAHANGSLHVVHGRWAHRLSVDLRPQAARELPQDRAYNSFVVLPDGHLVTKDLVMDGSAPSRLVVLDPDSLEIVAAEVAAPEASIARLSADHDVVYLVGDHSVFRYQWDGRRLALDADWSFRYRTAADQSYGWDPVIAGGHVWFMDNGAHRYAGTMRDRGVASGPVHLVRVAVDDARDHELVEISGLAGGAVTNPPLYDATSRIAVGYDSANGVLAAFRFDGALAPLWRVDLDTAGHLAWYPDDGTLVAYDHHETEDLVFLDLATGEERGRAPTGSPMQSVVFPAAVDGAVYYASFSTVARVG